MRPDAEVDEIALAVEADLLVRRDLGDPFGLVALADAIEEGDRLVALPDLAGDRLVALDDVAHPRLDLLEVLGGERRVAGEVVIEAGLGRRAEGDLGLRIQFLDRLGHHMGGVVAQDFERPRAESRVMIATAASWSMTVARSRGLPSSFSAIAALARPGPIDAASSAPLSGAGKLRLLPSGRVTIADDGASDDHSLRPRAPSIARFGRGRMVTKKPRPSAGGVCEFELCRWISVHDLTPRPAEWSSVTRVRPLVLMPGISPTALPRQAQAQASRQPRRPEDRRGRGCGESTRPRRAARSARGSEAAE